MSSGSEAIQNLQNAIKEIKTQVGKKAGKKLESQLPRLVENAMNQFYMAYNPFVYIRTYDLFSGVVSSFSSNVTDTYISWKVSSDNISQHSHDSGGYIFQGAFMQGIHGTSEIAVSTPPWMLYEEEAQELYEKYANDEIKKILSKYGV